MGSVCFDDRGELKLLKDLVSSASIGALLYVFANLAMNYIQMQGSIRSDTMHNLMKMNVSKWYRNRLVLQGSLGMLIILALLLVACGGASSSESSGASV